MLYRIGNMIINTESITDVQYSAPDNMPFLVIKFNLVVDGKQLSLPFINRDAVALWNALCKDSMEVGRAG